MTLRYIVGGLGFFAVSLVLGLALLLIAPLEAIRGLCALAIAAATAGCALHLAAFRRIGPNRGRRGDNDERSPSPNGLH